MLKKNYTRKTEGNLYGNEQRIIGPIRLPIFPAVDAGSWDFLDLGWVDSAGLIICFYYPSDQNIAITAIAMTAVHTQPNTFSLNEMTNRPITSGRTAISIITTIMGTEITQLMTALQKSALIGSMEVKQSPTPIKVDKAIMP